MPELPEVETVCRGLREILPPGAQLSSLERSSYKLRFRFPARVEERLKGQQLQSIQRRAKYILFKFDREVLINHLGMTGSWRPKATGELTGHEHVALQFSQQLRLVYNDPRRFGYFDLVANKDLATCRWFKALGPEPLDATQFDPDYLKRRAKSSGGSIKTFLMNQKIVVGVGNIYASESLHRAGVRPTRSPRSLTLKECERLVVAIQDILQQAIQAGGTTIRDFVSAGGDLGAYSTSLTVYGRPGQPCLTCAKPIQSYRLGGRATFSCAFCQH